ncbi:hypothetical protein ES705_49583 [subsurface metagenome]
MSSILTTASAPSGIGAPVEILIPSSLFSLKEEDSPISIVPTSLIIFGFLGEALNESSAFIAYPSMADRSKGGISISLTISIAKIRFKDSLTSISSIGFNWILENSFSKASSKGVNLENPIFRSFSKSPSLFLID